MEKIVSKQQQIEVLTMVVSAVQGKKDKTPEMTEQDFVIEVFNEYWASLGYKIREVECGGLFSKKLCFKVLEPSGDVAMVVGKEDFKFVESERVTDFDKAIVNSLGLRYRECLTPQINSFSDDKVADELFFKDSVRILLAVGFKLDNIESNKRIHESYRQDIAFAHGIDYQVISGKSETSKKSKKSQVFGGVAVLIVLWFLLR